MTEPERSFVQDPGPDGSCALLAWAEDKLGHRFADRTLLEEALTHRSLGSPNYERLEFLGDRLLGAIAALHLFRKFRDDDEGGLTRRYHQLVSGQTCAAIAREIGVHRHLRLNQQARADGAADSDNILGDVLEALIGALWLDGGPDITKAFIHRAFESRLGTAPAAAKHPKSQLQEWALARGLRPPAYELVSRSGPHHSPRFHVRLALDGFEPVVSSGSSKQEAETEAARRALARVWDAA
ncbi:ribonuclease III [Thermaurantiacus sp.]